MKFFILISLQSGRLNDSSPYPDVDIDTRLHINMNTESVGAEELHPETETTAIEDNGLNTKNISPSADELTLEN